MRVNLIRVGHLGPTTRLLLLWEMDGGHTTGGEINLHMGVMMQRTLIMAGWLRDTSWTGGCYEEGEFTPVKPHKFLPMIRRTDRGNDNVDDNVVPFGGGS